MFLLCFYSTMIIYKSVLQNQMNGVHLIALSLTSLYRGEFYYDQGKILKIGKGGVRGSTEISMIM